MAAGLDGGLEQVGRQQPARSRAGAAGNERPVDDVDVQVDVQVGAGEGQPVQLAAHDLTGGPRLADTDDADALLVAEVRVGPAVGQLADADLYDGPAG